MLLPRYRYSVLSELGRKCSRRRWEEVLPKEVGVGSHPVEAGSHLGEEC